MSKLVDDIAKLDLPDRDKLMMSMFPGLLFGFAPPNFNQLKERIECQTCLSIAVKFKQIVDMKMPGGFKHKLPWIRKSWRQQTDSNAQRILNEINDLENRDKKHWENEEAKGVSREFMTLFIGQDKWEHHNILTVQ